MSYQALETDGSGYGSIADINQAGLDMGLSDFMIEARVKIPTYLATNQYIVAKYGTQVGYILSIQLNTGKPRFYINNFGLITVIGDTNVCDGKWHLLVGVLDKSSATGLKIYIDGTEVTYDAQDDPTGCASLDNPEAMVIGASSGFTNRMIGGTDEVRIWNFGLNGLPADYEAYITWRYANPFTDLSLYNGGAWNGYADALRTERITYGALDDDNGEFENNGGDGEAIATSTDWTTSNTSAEIDDEAGSGVTTYNGSTFCAKIHTATADHSRIRLRGANLVAAFTLNNWYEISYDYKVANTTDAYFGVWRDSEFLVTKDMTSETWTTDRFIFQAANITGLAFRVYQAQAGHTGNEVVWIDNISIKRIGKVAHYKFDGDYLDETSNSNDLTVGGTGNTFPGYSLRSKGQKLLLGVG